MGKKVHNSQQSIPIKIFAALAKDPTKEPFKKPINSVVIKLTLNFSSFSPSKTLIASLTVKSHLRWEIGFGEIPSLSHYQVSKISQERFEKFLLWLSKKGFMKGKGRFCLSPMGQGLDMALCKALLVLG